MTLYRKKPMVVEAYKWMPDHETMDFRIPLPEWLNEGAEVKNNCLFICTPEVALMAIPGDWIVKDKRGDIRLVPAMVFESEYEALGEK